MPHTIESALDHPHVEFPLKFLSEYIFQLGDIQQHVTIRLYRPVGGEGVVFRQSHFIKTPSQGGSYRTSRPSNDSEASALNQVVSAMNEYYREAVAAGHHPDETWLEVNPGF